LTLRSNEILFLIGAGASKAFGIPTMKEMAQIMKQKLQGNTGAIYSEIVETLEENSTQGVDIEAVFSIIEYLLNKDKYASQNDILRYNLTKSGLTLGKIPRYNVTELRELGQELRHFVRNICVLDSSNTMKLSGVYSNFFNTISDALQGVPIHPNSNTKYDENWTIFTTNYDLCFETFWRDHKRIPLFTGFRSDEFSPNYFLYYSNGDLLNRNTYYHIMRLVKLHGSIAWLRTRDDQIKETVYNLDASETIGRGPLYEGEIVMYPLLEKHLYLDPYVQMFYCLNKEWQTKRTCISIGYSFRDSIVANIFSTFMKKDKEKRLIVIHPHASDIVSSVFDTELLDNFVLIERKFGDLNYREVNDEIRQALLSIV
jgi:NAD-dependent SIR2 family protein deacetylase